MARSLDAEQQAELSRFVNDLAARAGYETTAEWARDSGYPPPNLSKLRNGKMAIDGYNLLRLIRAAAERAEADPVQLALGAAPTVNDRLAELSDLVTEALSLLRDEARARTRVAKPAGRGRAKKRSAG